jgi:nucleoid-associated protein YgaU
MQRKEVRIALGVVGVLLVIFAGALIWRLGFSGSPKEDAVAAAPAESKGGEPNSKSADKPRTREPEAPAEAPTVLTATKGAADRPAAASPQIHEKASHEGLSWQGPYGGGAPAGEPAEGAAVEASHGAAAPNDSFAGYSGPAGDAFGAADDSPYGYGPDSQSEHGNERHAATAADGHAPVGAEPEDRAAAPPARGSRNQLRGGAAAAGGNPLRGQASQAPATNHFASERAHAAEPPAPDLSEQPHSAAPTQTAQAERDPLGAGGWSYSPTPNDSAATADETAAEEPEAAGPPHRPDVDAFTAAEPAAKAAAQPRRLDAAPAAAPKHGVPPAQPRGADVVTASAEAETSAPEPAAAAADAPPEGTYRVSARDTYWRIARSVYGDPAYYRALYEHNRKEHPRADRLAVGTLLETPDLATLERLYPQYCPTGGPN